MAEVCQIGFLNATDCAGYLANKGGPFREAYQITGDILKYCQENNETLESLSLRRYRQFHHLFEADIFIAIDIKNAVYKRQILWGLLHIPLKSILQK